MKQIDARHAEDIMRFRVLAGLLVAAVSCDGGVAITGQFVGFGNLGGFTISLAPPTATIAAGESIQLVPTVLDGNGQPLAGAPSPGYVSANPVIAFVSEGGLVTGVTPGRVTITATLSTGGETHSAASTITVTPTRAIGEGAVAIGDNFFAPSSLSVARGAGGAVVTWTWGGTRLHNVTFDDGGGTSPSQSGGTYTRTFTAAGTYTYYCSIHGRSVMSGSVTVQ